VKTAVARSLALLLIFASSAVAADISGRWVAQMPRGQMLTDSYFVFKVAGTKLTGTLTQPRGDYVYRMEIRDGTVSGEDVSFMVMEQAMVADKIQETGAKTFLKGKITGDLIEFTMERQPAPAGAPGAPPAGAPAAPAAGAPAAAPAAPAAPALLAFTAKRGSA
jgi:hypothetical protein